MRSPRNVAILIFDDVEVLDFSGPYEVFNVASEATDPPPFYVYTVGISDKPILARGRFVVTPRYSISNCPQANILIIPGGYGTRPLINHETLIKWLQDQAGKPADRRDSRIRKDYASKFPSFVPKAGAQDSHDRGDL